MSSRARSLPPLPLPFLVLVCLPLPTPLPFPWPVLPMKAPFLRFYPSIHNRYEASIEWRSEHRRLRRIGG